MVDLVGLVVEVRGGGAGRCGFGHRHQLDWGSTTSVAPDALVMHVAVKSELTHHRVPPAAAMTRDERRAT